MTAQLLHTADMTRADWLVVSLAVSVLVLAVRDVRGQARRWRGDR